MIVSPSLWKYEILGRRLARQKQPNRKREVFLSPSPLEQKGCKLKINGGILSVQAFVPGDSFEKKIGIKKRPRDGLSLGYFSNFGTKSGSKVPIIDKPVWPVVECWTGKGVGGIKSVKSRVDFSRWSSSEEPWIKGRGRKVCSKTGLIILWSLRVEVLDPGFSLISIHGEFKNISLCSWLCSYPSW